VKQAIKYLEILKKEHPIDWFTIHGGEPCLYFNDLIKIIKKASELKISKIGIITNSFWAKNEQITRIKLKKLKEAGLTNITFSIDYFHQQFIPIRKVETAITLAVEIGFERLDVDSYYLDNINTLNFHNRKNEEYLLKIIKLEEVRVSKFFTDLEGRAAETLSDKVLLQKDLPSDRCKLPFWIGGDLKNPETIEIDYLGNVTLCPGICIGNAKKENLNEIIKNYNYKNHLIIAVIEEKGPVGLLDLIKEKGFELRNKRYYNECHLCYELRKKLHPYYPNYLAPKGCYV
ncbi:MAG: hypothetical protein ACTSSF_11440, partial [Candidatus Heimdallarchaeaceae archaeon]